MLHEYTAWLIVNKMCGWWYFEYWVSGIRQQKELGKKKKLMLALIKNSCNLIAAST